MGTNLLEVCNTSPTEDLRVIASKMMAIPDGKLTPKVNREIDNLSHPGLQILILNLGSLKYPTPDKYFYINRKTLLGNMAKLEAKLTSINRGERMKDLYTVFSKLVYTQDQETVSFKVIYCKFITLLKWVETNHNFSIEEWRCKILSIFCFKIYIIIIKHNLEITICKPYLDKIFNNYSGYIVYNTKIYQDSYFSGIGMHTMRNSKLQIDFIDANTQTNEQYIHHADLPKDSSLPKNSQVMALYTPVNLNYTRNAEAAAAAAASTVAASAFTAASAAGYSNVLPPVDQGIESNMLAINFSEFLQYIPPAANGTPTTGPQTTQDTTTTITPPINNPPIDNNSELSVLGNGMFYAGVAPKPEEPYTKRTRIS